MFPSEVFIRIDAPESIALRHHADLMAAEISRVTGSTCHVHACGTKVTQATIIVTLGRGKCEQAYTLEIKPSIIQIEAADIGGLCSGMQTFRQVIESAEGRNLKCMIIRDWPEFIVRGFYHDVTRGKVPTLATLIALADKMAGYKLNQLQLYVEHTFAFKNQADIWEGADPLTADEIRALDQHCQKLNIDLVPSFSTFGHFYTAIRSRRKEHLNELEIRASERPHSLWDRMQHYTLDCSNPDSLKLIEELLNEYIPLFSSPYFNICCDETFDLGKGRNAGQKEKTGEGLLYLGFLKKVMAIVQRHGKIPMFWGDIILKHPELIKHLPRNVVSLNWDYAAEPKPRTSALFKQAGLRYYVCPGVQGWRSLINHVPDACANIINFAKQGRRYGAEGLLNTDWGDYGHINLLANCYHGLVFGASAAWNLKAAEDLPRFDASMEAREFGDPTGRTCALLRQGAEAVTFTWNFICWWFDPSPDMATWEREKTTGMLVEPLKKDAGKYLASYRKLLELRQELTEISRKATPADPLAYREIICGFTGCALLHAAILVIQSATGYSKVRHGLSALQVANEIRVFEQELSTLWHLRNKPSEYWRLKTLLIETARRLDALA